MDYPAILVDVPTGKKDCRSLFQKMMNRAPNHIQARKHSRGTHTGRGTSWAGGYITYEIYDQRRPDWPTAEAEKWGNEIRWAISHHLGQRRIR